jgi:hypothetical protein
MKCSIGVSHPVVTDPESFLRGFRESAGPFMSSHAVHAIAGRTLRHWTIDSREVGGGSEWPAPALPYSQPPDGCQVHLLVSKLARLKSLLARRLD